MSDVSKPLATDKTREAAQKQKDAADAAAKIKEAKEYAPTNQDALAEAQAGIDEHLDDYTKAQGRAAEKAALEKLSAGGAPVTDLNTHLGSNFPLYDVASDQQVASVKCRGLRDGATLKDTTVNTYITDLEDAAGNVTNPEKFKNAVRYLRADASANPAGYPPELSAGPQQAEKYLRENAKLMIPDDHAVQVKNELSRRLFGDDPMRRQTAASRLGLGDVNAPDYPMRVNATLDRIEGVGVRSTQIKQMLDQAPGVW